MIEASALIAEARKLKGVSWKHQGRSVAGVDCIGLMVLAASNLGLDLFGVCGLRDRRNYARKPDPAMFALIEKHCTPTTELVPGSLLLFRFYAEPHPRHLGLLSDSSTVIHAEAKTRGFVVEHGYRAHWVKWTHSRWLLPGVKY